MLVLTRKPGQKIRVMPAAALDPHLTVAELFAKGPIEIVVTHVQGLQVKLGVHAPRELLVLREELAKPPTKDPNRR